MADDYNDTIAKIALTNPEMAKRLENSRQRVLARATELGITPNKPTQQQLPVFNPVFGEKGERRDKPVLPVAPEVTAKDYGLRAIQGAAKVVDNTVTSTITSLGNTYDYLTSDKSPIEKIKTVGGVLLDSTPTGVLKSEYNTRVAPYTGFRLPEARIPVSDKTVERIQSVRQALSFNNVYDYVEKNTSEGAKQATKQFNEELAIAQQGKGQIGQSFAKLMTHIKHPEQAYLVSAESAPVVLGAILLRNPRLAMALTTTTEGMSGYADVINARIEAGQPITQETLDIAKRTGLVNAFVTLVSGKIANKAGVADLAQGKLTTSVKDMAMSMTLENLEESIIAMNTTAGTNQATGRPLEQGMGNAVADAIAGTVATKSVTDTPNMALQTLETVGQSVANLKTKLTTPSIESQLDTTQGNKHFNPKSAYLRATETIANSQDEQEIKQAKKYQDKAVQIVNERLGAFDEAIEKETDEAKRQKLIQRRDNFYTTHYEPVINATKVVNNSQDTTEDSDVVSFVRRHNELRQIQERLQSLSQVSDERQRQQALQGLQEQLNALGQTQPTQQTTTITPHGLANELSPKDAQAYMESKGIKVTNSRGSKTEPFAGGNTKGDTLAFAELVFGSHNDLMNGFSGFNDNYHKGSNSYHAKGMAFDISVKDKSVEGMATFRKHIIDLANQNGYDVVVLAEHPEGKRQGKEGFGWYPKSTAPHMHITVKGRKQPTGQTQTQPTQTSTPAHHNVQPKPIKVANTTYDARQDDDGAYFSNIKDGNKIIKHYAFVEAPSSEIVSPLDVEGISLKRGVHKDALNPLKKMIADAKAQGVTLTIASDYRSHKDQQIINENNVKKKGTKAFITSAPSGYSEHSTGLAIDFNSVNGADFKQGGQHYKAHQWLVQNAHKYGFEQTFTEEYSKKTNVSVEEWHWKFTGTDRAKQLLTPIGRGGQRQQAPTQPKQTNQAQPAQRIQQLDNKTLVFGDSLGVGFAVNMGHTGDKQGRQYYVTSSYAYGGKPASWVLDQLKTNQDKVQGKTVVLSTGLSNTLANLRVQDGNKNAPYLDSTKRKAEIEKVVDDQLSLLKKAGATVVVTGIVSDYNEKQLTNATPLSKDKAKAQAQAVNAMLKQKAHQYGFAFYDVGKSNGDTVHPASSKIDVTRLIYPNGQAQAQTQRTGTVKSSWEGKRKTDLPKNSQYIDMMRRTYAKYGFTPQEQEFLIAQVAQESRFNPKAKSHAGAMGLAQFIPATWQTYGKGKDPYDPEASIDAQARFMQDLLKQFDGDWAKALAGYNAGAGNVRKHKGVPPFKETQNYVNNVVYWGKQWSGSTITNTDTPQATNTQTTDTQSQIDQLLAELEQDQTNQDLQDQIDELQAKLDTQNTTGITEEQLQAKIQEEMDKLKEEQGKNIAIRYAQVNAQDEQAVNKAKTEIDELQTSGLLDENQANNLRKLLDIKVAIKGTNQEDVHHQIINGKRGANNLETNLGLNDYDQVFTMALAGNTPDSATINRYMGMLTRFRDSHNNKAEVFQQAYNEAINTGASIVVVPERTDKGVRWRGATPAEIQAKEENVFPIEIHRGSGKFVNRVVDEAKLLSDFTNTWDNILRAGESIQAQPQPQEQTQTQPQTQPQTNEINVGKARAGNKIISLSAVNNGSVEAGVDGWLGNPFNVGGNHGWSVKDDKDKWTSYADLLVKTLKNNDKALSAFMDLQDKPLAQSDEQVVVSALLNELSKGNPKEMLANYQGYDYDNKTFDFTPQRRRVVKGKPIDDTGFYVGRQNIGNTPNDLAKTIKNTDRIGKNGWLGNPYSTKSKTHKTKDYNEALDKYAITLRDFLLSNDKALKAFLSLQDKTLHKPSTMNAKTEADVVGQMLDAVEGKSIDEAKAILANITGFGNGQLQIQQATNSGNKQQTSSKQTKDVTKQQKTSDTDSGNVPQNQSKPIQTPAFGERKGLASLPDVPVVSIDTKALGFKDTKRLADDILRTLQTAPIGTLHNKDTGWDLVVGKKDRKKMGNNKQLSHNTSQAIQGIEALVDNAVLVETHQDDKHNNTNVIAVHRLYVPAMVDGQLNRVKLTVKDYVLTDGSERKNLHAIEAVEIETPSTGNSTIQPVDSSTNHKGGKLSIEQLLTGVNRDGDGKPFSVGLSNDPFAHLTDEDLKQANEQVEQNRDSELERQAQDIDRLLAEVNNESIDPDYYENYDIPVDSESSAPKKKSLKDKVNVAVNVKTELTGVKPLHQVIDDLGLTADHLMITKAINNFYDLKVSFDGSTGKDVVSYDNLMAELVAYGTNQVLDDLQSNTDNKALDELRASLETIKRRLSSLTNLDKKDSSLVAKALDSDYNLVGLAVTDIEFQYLLKRIEHNETVHKNLFSKLVYGLMSVFGIPNKTTVNNLYEKTLITIGDLIAFQATNNQSKKSGNLSILQNVDRQAELAKPIVASTAGTEQNLIKAGITQGNKKPLAAIKNLSIKLASEGLSVLAHNKPTDKQLAQLEHFLAFKQEMAELLQQALPKDNYSNWDYQDLKQALIREGIDDNLLTAMALSAYDKILADGGKTFHSRDDVAKLFGFKPDAVFVPNDVHKEFLHIHAHLPSFATDLGRQVSQALELSQTKDVPAQTLARLEASLGNWLVSALQIGGYVHTITMPKNEYEHYKAKIEDKEFKAGDDKSTLTFVSFTDVDGNNKSDVVEEIAEVAKETGSYLADTFGVESAKRYPKLTPPNKVKDKIKKTKSKVSKDQAKKIDIAQKEAIYINQDMQKVLEALDKEIPQLLGAVVTEEELAKLHVSKRKGAMERAEAIKRELDNHKEWASFVGDKPFYDTVTVAVNKRMHYDSNVWNFQSSTVQRAFGEPESFRVSMDAKFNFTDDKGKPTVQGLFLRAVFENAEGTEAFFKERLSHQYPQGWTVDKLPTSVFAEVAMEYIQQPHVQKALLAIQKTQQGEKLTQDDITAIKDIVKEWKMEARSLRALMELSNFLHAVANKKEFTTSLGSGSDGVNNGIGIAHVLMGINDELTLAQVGILKEQYPSYFATRTDSTVGDYYESFGGALKKGIADSYDFIRNHKKWDDKFKTFLLHKAHAIEELSTTLKKRATYKAIIIPFGYGAGYGRLQKAASEQMIGDIIKTLEDIYHGRAEKGAYDRVNKNLKTLLGNNFNLPPAKGLLEFEFTKQQINELKKSHKYFLGRAIKSSLEEYAGEFIERRTNFIQMQQMASVGFVKAKEILTNNALKAHQEKVASTYKDSKLANRAREYIGLDGHQLDELEQTLAPVRPKVESIYSLKSGSDDTAKIQLTTNERTLVKDVTKGHTKELDGDELVNRQRLLLTQATTEASNGVTPNSQTVQSTDSYVSSEAMVAEGVVSINVHDANIASLIHYFAMAMTQNKAFFYGTAMYHLGYQNIKTLVDTLTNIKELNLSDKELDDIHKKMVDSLGENYDFGGHILTKDKLSFYLNEMLQIQINNDLSKLDMYLGITTIHQYAGEGGEYKLTQKDYDFLTQEKEHLLGLKEDLQKQIDGMFGDTHSQTRQTASNQPNTQDKSFDKNQPQNTPKANANKGVTIDKFFDKKVLNTYAKDAKDGQKELYQMLAPLLPDGLKFATGTLPNPNAVAGFVGDTIVFNAPKMKSLSDTDKMRYVNHELIHALTEYGLAKDSKASKDLQAMYDQLKPLANTDTLKLAFENVNEFVAYGLTDKAVQQFILDNLDTKALGIKTPSKIKNALDNFLKAVFSLFGLTKSSSYKAFVASVDTVIQEGLGKPFATNQQRSSQEHTLTDRQQAIDILQGKAIASINQADVDMPKQGGFKAITEWAMEVFASQGGKAVNPVLGDVILNNKSIRDSLGHGSGFFKNLAFPLVKDVIEQGAIIAKDSTGKEDSYFVSAPVLMDGKPNIITVTIHADANTQRMYLHSVTMTEKLLVAKKDTHLVDPVPETHKERHGWNNINQAGNQSTIQVSTASSNLDELGSLQNDGLSGSAVKQNTKTYGKSGRISKNHNGSITPSEVHNILHDLLTSKPSIRYASVTATDTFKALDSSGVSDEFNEHLDSLIERFISPYDKADVDKIEHLADKGLPTNAKLLHLGLSSKEAHTIEALTTVFTAYLKDNGAITANRLSDLYRDAQKQFKTAKDLFPDYDSMTSQEKLLARNVHQYAFNNKTKQDNVARFMAMVLASEKFKDLIDSHKIKKGRDNNTWFDKAMLAIQTVIDWFIGSVFASNESNSKHIKGLLTSLAKLEANARITPADSLQDRYEQGFKFTFNPLNKAIKTGLAKAFDNELFINSKFSWLQTVGKAAHFANSPNRDAVAADFVARMQGGMFAGERMNPIMETFNELSLQGIRGKVIDAVTRITQKLGQTRQQVEANTYKILKDSFGHTTKEENIAITHALVKTDVQALISAGFSVDKAMAMLDDTKRQQMIERYQNKLAEDIKNTKQFNTTMHAINSLGLYMATGIASLHLQKNSDNIARGIGTKYSTQQLDTNRAKIVDILATLYALNHTDKTKLEMVKQLYARESEGITKTLYLHQDMVKKAKADFIGNPLNYQKGYITQLFNPYSKVVFVTSLEEQRELEKKGFETIGELEQDPLDNKDKSILMVDKYHSPNNYVSGMLDMYDTSHKGTEIYNSVNEPEAIGKIVNKKIANMEQLATLSVDQVNPMDTQGAMIANYNSDGSIDNYRYEMNDKSKETLLEQDMDFIHVLSAQNANLVYKPQIKEQQIKSAKIVIEEAKNFKKYPSQYVLLDFASRDPNVAQMMAMIPYPFRQELEQHFGKGQPIPIHNTMYNALFGFRAYSLVEAFDKLDDPDAKLNFAERALTGTMTLIFKDKARHYTFAIEKAVQTLMSYIKEAIVVKSGGVLMGNIIQNLWLLAMHGINPLQIVTGTVNAWRNSKRFSNDSNRLTQLEALINSTKDKHKISAYKKEMKTIEERLANNPMKAFMEAGMMSTIVEDLAMQEETKFKSHYEKKIAGVTDKIPDFIKTPANIILMNKGTAMYQFLAEATQFSDLAAKYVLTEHHYKSQLKKGVAKDKAMIDAIYLAQESFVNYDIPTSRTLDYLNRVGLMVFTKFFLRFQKALIRFAVHAPAQSFVMNEMAEATTGTSIYDPFLLARLGNNPFDGSLLLADDAVGNLITTSVLF